jgi:MoxR-like ATPase
MEVLSEAEIACAGEKLNRLRTELNAVLFGQEQLIEHVLTGLLARGHLLLEGLPGLGKTELVKGLAKSLGMESKRIQFTPDLLPGDITGNPVLQEINGRREFVFQPGPLFANLVLADEINRASPKTQSALLEAMQERRVTVMGQTHPLPEPFFVIATQNPIELEGTYPLPEAQLDRFLFKLDVPRTGVSILERIVTGREMGVEPTVNQVLTREGLLELSAQARRIYLPPVVANYIARLVDATHPGVSKASQGVKFGASPRAALGLAAGVRARALLYGRMNASFEDVAAIAKPVLAHRVLLDYSARLTGQTSAGVIDAVLAEVPVQDRETPSLLTSAKV